jgi:hypothetical protein
LLLAGLAPFSIGLLVAITVPVVLPCTLLGVKLYRQMSDVNFRRVTFILLGVSGLGLLVKAAESFSRGGPRGEGGGALGPVLRGRTSGHSVFLNHQGRQDRQESLLVRRPQAD